VVPAFSQEFEKEGTMGVIVVGVDHSEGAKAALRFALGEAKLRQASLRVVHAWQLGYVSASFDPGSYPVLGGELGDLRGAAETVLVDESREADLLVVGSRGLGGFSGLLLGSVSQQCAHHAACPVVIVRAPPEKSD
jgi:nucleotide-binding universal stress UspA family protein